MNFEGNMANSDWIYTVKEPIFRQVNNAISYQPGVLKIQRETNFTLKKNDASSLIIELHHSI